LTPGDQSGTAGRLAELTGLLAAGPDDELKRIVLAIAVEEGWNLTLTDKEISSLTTAADVEALLRSRGEQP